MWQILQILVTTELQVEIPVCPSVITLTGLHIRAVTLIPWLVQELPSQPPAHVR